MNCSAPMTDPQNSPHVDHTDEMVEMHSPGVSETIIGEDIVVGPEDEELYLNTGRIYRIQNLESAVRLKKLSLVAQQIATIEGLEKNELLEYIDLYQNQITEINGLEHLTQLKYLDLSFNRIREIQNIQTLVNLTELHLASNKITEIKNLDSLQNLRVLELGSNRITNPLMGLEKLSKLEELWLGKNRIHSLDLPPLLSVTKLSLQSNRLQNWFPPFFDRFINLEELYLSHNGFTLVPPEISKLKNLRVLDLAGNRISSMSTIGLCEHLEELWINDNEIESADELKHLSRLVHLTTIYLERNPIQQLLGPGYRTAVANANPRISQVDAIQLTATSPYVRAERNTNMRSSLKVIK